MQWFVLIEVENIAKEMELWIETNLHPPFKVGHPRLATTELLEKVQSNTEKGFTIRDEIIKSILNEL